MTTYIVTDMGNFNADCKRFRDLRAAEKYAIAQTFTPDVGVFGIWEEDDNGEEEICELVYDGVVFEP
jgi:hypothetical protein